MIESAPVVVPPLTWPGSKRASLSRLEPLLPRRYQSLRHVEPFAGAAVLFFAFRPNSALLADTNDHLIRFYKQLARAPQSIADYASSHGSKHGEDHYYRTRAGYNRRRSKAWDGAQAARFLYLNKACFNGIFRVNLKGEFNTPFNWKEIAALPSKVQLLTAAALLRRAEIQLGDFSLTLGSAGRGDFVYCDPPYVPLNKTAYFTHYTSARFGLERHQELREGLVALDRKGAKIMISGADDAAIRRLYRGWHPTRVMVRRFVTCKREKHEVPEIVLRNYTT